MTSHEIDSFRAAVTRITPVACVHCGAPGATQPDTAERMFAGHRDRTPRQLRNIQVAACLELGWGFYGLNAHGELGLTCPACATTAELAHGRNERLATDMLHRQMSGPALN